MSNLTASQKRNLGIFVAVTLIAAALPHYYFTPPLALHLAGDFKGWLGIAVWAPAILAGMAFLIGVGFGEKLEPAGWNIPPALRPAIYVLAPVLYAVVIVGLYPNLSNDLPYTPWNELAQALPLHAAMAGLQVTFWQGLLQKRLMDRQSPELRVSIITMLSVAIWIPFAHLTSWDILGYAIIAIGVEAFLTAIIFEIGATVGMTMIIRAVLGLVYVWFQQATFL